MPDDVFRIFVAIAVGLACIAFVVQAGVMLALYSVTRKMQQKTASLLDRVDPLVGKVEPLIAKIHPIMDRAEVLMQKAGPVIDKAGPAVEKLGMTIGSVDRMIEENRAAVKSIVAN